jgi:hypothetical protein
MNIQESFKGLFNPLIGLETLSAGVFEAVIAGGKAVRCRTYSGSAFKLLEKRLRVSTKGRGEAKRLSFPQ